MKNIISFVVALMVATSVQAEPPTQEEAQKILKQQEERIRNYERCRAEIVEMVPALERAELNWLACLADAGYFDAETMTKLDKAGAVLIIANLHLVQAAALLPKTYGSEGDPANAEGLDKEMFLARGGFYESIGRGSEVRKKMTNSPRWAVWLSKNGLDIKSEDPQLKKFVAFITLSSIPRQLNEMAVTLDAGLIKEEDFPQLDGLGPLFIRALLADEKTEQGQKLADEVETQVQALYDAWLGLLNNLPQSERWVTWVDTLTAKGEWRNTAQEQAALARLIAEEHAARKEKK